MLAPTEWRDLKRIKIFLASSAELEPDRREFEILIARKCADWADQDVFLQVVLWEDFLDALSATRLQDGYNTQIRECDLFVLLFWTKVGKYTEEEFGVAVGQFQATRKPFIFTYFKAKRAARRALMARVGPRSTSSCSAWASWATSSPSTATSTR